MYIKIYFKKKCHGGISTLIIAITEVDVLLNITEKISWSSSFESHVLIIMMMITVIMINDMLMILSFTLLPVIRLNV